MTTANQVTIGRILLVPFFIVAVIYYVKTGVELYRWLAIACFALAAISDGIDGFLARHFNQWSELGTILDPLADKLLLVSGIVLLSLHNEPRLPGIPIWLTVTILSRDVLVLLGLALIHFIAGKVKVKPHLIGKAATVLQMASVLWALFKWNEQALYWICVAAAVLTGISGLIYVFDGTRQLAKHPASLPIKIEKRDE
ncbi:MAG TPA: CDP-alcohol phosphatidyltransferase family protein [Methylomirabilota bacterium]|nr:CDP-alcohol phosphatidyltransferase family protein [Methylomirabilota bacterium]